MFRLTILLCAIALLASPFVAFAQADPTPELLRRINALRVQNGLAPYALNDQLAAAAQRNSQDMANTGNVSHTGSDGTNPEQRIDAAGFTPHNAWGENIYGGGIATVDDAWNFWTTSTVHRNNLLSERHREIGIGVATSERGTYYTLNFGSRPGVLPFFVNQVDGPNVTLTLSNEEASSGSSGTMGRAVEVRVAEGEDTSLAAWQPWQRSIPLTLASDGGEHRITVEYRDARGITATYYRLVTLTGASVQPTIEPTIQPSSTPTAAPTDTPTPLPSSTSTVPPTDTPTPLPADTPTSQPVIQPFNAHTPVPAITSTLPPSDTPTTQPAIDPTIQPTNTLLSTPDDRSPIAALIDRGWSDAPGDVLGVLIGLNVAAIAIGAVAFARRTTRK